MLTIYLCDDNQAILEQYRAEIHRIADKNDISAQVRTFCSGASMLFYIEDEKERVDIIYLDIIMEGENGMQTAARLRNFGCDAELIFLTANPEYVFDSFDVSPLYYIIKGSISSPRFEEIFLKAANNAKKSESEVFICANGATQKRIPFSDIYYFEVSNRIITVHYGSERFEFYMKMEALEKDLESKNFIRIHRSYLVHISCIEQITRDSVTLVNREVLPLGITYSKEVKKALNHYLSHSNE